MEVILSPWADQDLEELIRYIGRHDSAEQARHVLDSLSTLPERGPIVPELSALGITRYRQVFFKPYRIVYRVQDTYVRVLLIQDGRRDMKTLLKARLMQDTG